MQYNGYLAMQKQTSGHEHMLNMSIYIHIYNMNTDRDKNVFWGWGATFKAAASEKAVRCLHCLPRAGWRDSDSPQALAAKSCLGHLALA